MSSRWYKFTRKINGQKFTTEATSFEEAERRLADDVGWDPESCAVSVGFVADGFAETSPQVQEIVDKNRKRREAEARGESWHDPEPEWRTR